MARHRTTFLSGREMDVLMLYCAGNSCSDVGHILGISYHTVRSHLRRVHERTGTTDRLGLALWVCRNGGTNVLYLIMMATNGRQSTEAA